MCSPVDSSYLLLNLSLSVIIPLALRHETSGFGFPVTVALKTAAVPEGCMEILNFHVHPLNYIYYHAALSGDIRVV